MTDETDDDALPTPGAVVRLALGVAVRLFAIRLIVILNTVGAARRLLRFAVATRARSPSRSAPVALQLVAQPAQKVHRLSGNIAENAVLGRVRTEHHGDVTRDFAVRILRRQGP
jgi:hypothetical protein